MKTKNTKLNIKNSYPLKTLTLDCQKTMMRELMMDNKMITSSDFKQPYSEHFKYIPIGTSIENGNVITGQFGVYKEDVFIRQMDDFDYQIKYPIVFEMDSNENLSTSNEEIIITTKHDAFRDLLLIKETKSDGEVWFKVPNSVSSPNIDLVIEDLKNQTGKRENSCDEDEKAVLNHFKNFIKEIVEYLLKNGIVITIDNIHLYYEFMDNNEKLKYINIYDAALKKRSLLVQNLLNINKDTFFDNKPLVSFTTFNSTTLGMLSYLSIFGVRDTLKPIDEYISDIKNSDAFKEFEKEKQLQEAIDITNVVIIDFSEEEIAEYIDRCIIYLHNRFDPKYIVKIWETDEIYGERDDEDDYSEEYQGHSMYQGKIASSDGAFENDIKFTGTYCEISAVFSDLLTDLKMIEKSNA